LKGGVGKTTLAVNIAADLAHYYNKSVLLIDLDPQTNSTISLVTPSKYLELKKEEKTLKKLYDMQLDSRSHFNFDTTVYKHAGNVKKLDLLVSDLELIDIDIRLSHIPNNHAIIRNELEKEFNSYDFVIFDCPPNLGVLTQNGLFASDFYVVPVQPDFLSTFGIELIRGRVDWFKAKIGTSASRFDLRYGGLIFNRVRNTSEHNQKMLELRARQELNPIFKSIIYERTAISEASAQSIPVCLSKIGFGWKDVDSMFRICTEEFLTMFEKVNAK
jgi:chromosome partitioning protein